MNACQFLPHHPTTPISNLPDYVLAIYEGRSVQCLTALALRSCCSLRIKPKPNAIPVRVPKWLTNSTSQHPPMLPLRFRPPSLILQILPKLARRQRLRLLLRADLARLYPRILTSLSQLL